MAFVSTTPDAIAALVAGLRPVLGERVVRDGVTASGEVLAKVLTVGFSGEETTSTADGAAAIDGMRPPQREQYAIHCAAEARTGAVNDVANMRAQVFEMYGAAADYLASNPNLDGVVLSATIGSWSLAQIQPDKGTAAQLLFDVDIDAYWKRV